MQRSEIIEQLRSQKKSRTTGLDYSEGSDSDIVNDAKDEDEKEEGKEESKIEGKKLNFNTQKIEPARTQSRSQKQSNPKTKQFSLEDDKEN